MAIPSLLEVQVPASVDGTELAGLIAGPEFLGLWEQRGSMRIYWKGSEESIFQKIQKAFAHLGADLPDSSINIQMVIPQDWNAQWAASVTPIRIGRRIGIRPSWAPMELPSNGIEIILDPKQAFGTGHHATTHLLIEWLESFSSLLGCRILDVGTGSGILSMVALRLGAEYALGLDTDAVAIECAKDYALDNGFNQEMDLRSCSTDEIQDQSFEIILANIDRKTIVDISPDFSRFRSAGTQLFLSGLLEEDAIEVVEHMTKQGWAHNATREREGWVALQFLVVSSEESSSGLDSRKVIRA